MSYIRRTISYFLTWGTFYGVLLGGLTGTALLPLIGTAYGVVLGVGAGVIAGLIAGFAAIAFQAAQFDRDSDLVLHRRRVARQVGSAVVLVPIVIWIISMALRANLGFILSALFLLVTLPWAGLAAAYVAHRYPDEIVKRMTKGKRGQLTEYEDDLRPEQSSVVQATAALWRRGSLKWRMLLGALVVAFLHVTNRMMYLSSLPLARQGLEILLAGLGGVLVAEMIWACLALANGVLLTMLKRVVFQDYFPDMPARRYRRILTGLSFFFTLIISWWTLIFAPIIAALTAYSVYHSIALPPESLEKAKRKEKNVLALEENMAEEEDHIVLMESERLMRTDQ